MCALDLIESYCNTDSNLSVQECTDDDFSEDDVICEFLDHLKSKEKISIVHWTPSKKDYPDYMFLSGDKGILAYLEFKYIKFSKENCQECIKVDSETLLKKVRLVDSQLDRPLFFVYILNSNDKPGIYFETNEQIKDRWFHNPIHSEIYQPVIDEMGDYSNLISILTDLKLNNVRI